MATPILLPKLGNSVESSIIVAWLKQPGEAVSEGDPICTIETDKTTVEVTSTASGILLKHLAQVGDDVPVMAEIAWVGSADETLNVKAESSISNLSSPISHSNLQSPHVGISPRARKLAEANAINPDELTGSGPGGRVIERDVQAAMANASHTAPKLTPVAQRMVAQGDFVLPEVGSGSHGRITKQDLIAAKPTPISTAATPQADDDVEVIPLKGVRKVIAERMLASLQSTAQLTMTASADARALQAYRRQLKASPEALGLREVTINDLVLLAVSRVLPQHGALNALFTGDAIAQHKQVHLAFAVDTPRGLLVPVIRRASALSLKTISREAKRLAAACVDGTAKPEDLNGGTFTVSNLGAFGVETFTPVLNPPQVAILGVGGIGLKAIPDPSDETQVMHVPHLQLSLTINHQVVDGAPAARFLQALAQAIAQIELTLAV